ncbi:Hypothetical_protein [Hexamita inflata]|uniref:Hypothetical_protein n=1 Tax=Hexamita inflata TaxID=28002 RepID=A0AA86QUC2_9EUKA|nr:Hypothetical protein HINF_LOCUS53854 [Hexamita inflata]
MLLAYSFLVPCNGQGVESPDYTSVFENIALNQLHIFASTENVTSRTQVAFLYWNSISSLYEAICRKLEECHELRPGMCEDDGLSCLYLQLQHIVLIPAFRLHLISC